MGFIHKNRQNQIECQVDRLYVAWDKSLIKEVGANLKRSGRDGKLQPKL